MKTQFSKPSHNRANYTEEYKKKRWSCGAIVVAAPLWGTVRSELIIIRLFATNLEAVLVASRPKLHLQLLRQVVLQDKHFNPMGLAIIA